MKQVPTNAIMHSHASLANADLSVYDSVDDQVLHDYAVNNFAINNVTINLPLSTFVYTAVGKENTEIWLNCLKTND